MPKLYVMRHAIAENTSPDVDRKLSPAGQNRVKLVAKTLSEQGVKINQVIYSSAARTTETALLMCQGLSLSFDNQQCVDRMYNAPVDVLQAVVAAVTEPNEAVLLIGHNPGLAQLVFNLSGEPVHMSAGDVAVLQGDSWQGISNSQCQFISKY